MKVTDLQIGDWVYITPWEAESPLIGKVTAVNYNSWQGKDYCDWIDVEGWDEISPRDIQQIPLTLEIFEKNGWKYEFDKTDYMVKYDLNKKGENSWMMWSINEHIVDVQKQAEHIEKYNLCVQRVYVPCDFVHELQHAMKECRIKDEITI